MEPKKMSLYPSKWQKRGEGRYTRTPPNGKNGGKERYPHTPPTDENRKKGGKFPVLTPEVRFSPERGPVCPPRPHCRLARLQQPPNPTPLAPATPTKKPQGITPRGFLISPGTGPRGLPQFYSSGLFYPAAEFHGFVDPFDGNEVGGITHGALVLLSEIPDVIKGNFGSCVLTLNHFFF